VRDPVLAEALNRLAAEAATRFSSLVATGDEIPFDVAEADGDNAPFYRYVPLTARFIEERRAELRSLRSFEPACAAVASAGVAAAYLEARGRSVPADARERAAEMLTAFVAGLWDGSSEFSLDRPRLERALHMLDCETRDLSEAEVLIAPLVGLQMSLPRLQLPSGVRIVRADTVDAPLEAMRSEGMQRTPWEPQFLALAEQSGEPQSSVAGMGQLRDLISVMRLFKEGGIGLGPYVFAAAGEGQWRRLSTGAPATRLGGYSLSEQEADELREFARRLAEQPDPRGALACAVARFEMGCERPTALEGMSDHLLALRALLEGEGPVGADLALRTAALIAEPEDREDAGDRVLRAVELERTLMAGERMEQSGVDTGTALGLAVWIEGGLRTLLRDAALGDLGGQISVAADETLITSGLEAGEGSAGQMGSTDEWDIPEPHEISISQHPDDSAAESEQLPTDPAAPEEAAGIYSEEAAEFDSEPTRIIEPIPTAEDEIRVTALNAPAAGEEAGEKEEETEKPRTSADWGFDDDDQEESPMSDRHSDRDWLSEVSREERTTLEWPAGEGSDPRERERIDTPRVRHLFPVPEDAEWEVRELDYDRRRRRTASR
jgi:hypothetical protein